MIYLALRTDKPESEIAIYKDSTALSHHKWLADRILAETIHKVMQEQLEIQGLNLEEINGVVFYQGPGSFTGLRIGASVANALAASIATNIVGTSGDNWINEGIEKLRQGENEKIVVPDYGALPNITKQKK